MGPVLGVVPVVGQFIPDIQIDNDKSCQSDRKSQDVQNGMEFIPVDGSVSGFKKFQNIP